MERSVCFYETMVSRLRLAFSGLTLSVIRGYQAEPGRRIAV
jgi:hypothetical protein